MGKEIFDNARPLVKETLVNDLALRTLFEEPPEVMLSLYSQTPPGRPNVGVSDIAISTAIQCYSSGKAVMKPRNSDKEQLIGEGTLEGGHHTTRQHANFTWRLSGVSRNAIHEVFHNNPFYNTEQQSQRYVEASDGSYLIPNTLESRQKEIFKESAAFANKAYFELLVLLQPAVGKRVNEMYPEDGWRTDSTKIRLEDKGKKISQEVARYVLPIAQKSNFYYDLSELQLLRMFRASKMSNFSSESRFVIARMIEEVAIIDPTILKELDKPLEVKNRNKRFYWQTSSTRYLQKNTYDERLEGMSSRMKPDVGNEGRLVLADTIRNILGLTEADISDNRTLRLLLDPAKNSFLSDVYEIGMLDPLTASLRQINLTYETKLSHTADSQRQRHRRTPGATPPIDALYDGHMDYITPLIIRENWELLERYEEVMSMVYQNVERAIDSGISKEWALLLLPNAHAIRVTESGDLFDWVHRWKQRLCYLAQEEIFFISVEQAAQALSIYPEAKNLFLAPCGVRQSAGEKPRCPEGNRWCGKPVWDWQLKKYQEERLI